MKAPTRRAITVDKARFAGDIVAAVVASDLAAAEDAVDLVQVDYEVLPAVVDQEAAMRTGAPLLHDDVPGNTAFTWKLEGGDQSVFDTAPVKAQVRLVNQRLIPNPMEGRAVLAQWSAPTVKLTMWTSTQIPHLVRLQLSRVLDLPEHKTRVIAPDVGGGFGAKQNFYPEEMLIAALAIRLRRPVKWVEQRRENFVAMTHGRDHIQDAEIVGQRDGTISGPARHVSGQRGRLLLDVRAGRAHGPVRAHALGLLPAPHRVVPGVRRPHQHHHRRRLPRRGPARGGPPGRAAREHVRGGAGMDPVEVRRKNFIPRTVSRTRRSPG